METKKIFNIPIETIPEGVDQDEFVRGVLEQFKKDGLPPLDIEINNYKMEKSNELPAPEGIDMDMDIEYMTEKRDQQLERFNRNNKELKDDEAIQNSLSSLMRVNTQLRMMEEARTIYNSTNKK